VVVSKESEILQRLPKWFANKGDDEVHLEWFSKVTFGNLQKACGTYNDYFPAILALRREEGGEKTEEGRKNAG
jgi:hypothetical protein